MPFQRQQQCQTCLKHPPVFPHSIPHMLGQHASYLSEAIKSNELNSLADFECVPGDQISH